MTVGLWPNEKGRAMTSVRERTRYGTLAAIAALVALTPSATASASTTAAVKLRGDWAAFTRCPVSNARMLAATGQAPGGSGLSALCVAADSPGGSIKLGSTAATTGDTNLQAGLVGSAEFSVVSPAGGGIVAAPVDIPGGLLGLICPSSIPVISAICQEIVNSPLNTVAAVVQPAGRPSHFNLGAGLTMGEPILRLPVKVQLQNPILGSDCYLGSNSDPIILKPENLVAPKLTAQRFDANGTPDPRKGVLEDIVVSGEQGDNSFSVPGATGCGGPLSSLIDPILDFKEGLPSPAGNNSLVLNNAVTSIAGYVNTSSVYPNEGKDLSADWHSAVLP
jgi:hypothetical protein